jgi:hypothetical protein
MPCIRWSLEEDRKRELGTIAIMKIATVFALTFLTSLLLASAQESDEANTVLQAERDLAAAYLNSDADGRRRT